MHIKGTKRVHKEHILGYRGTGRKTIIFGGEEGGKYGFLIDIRTGHTDPYEEEKKAAR